MPRFLVMLLAIAGFGWWVGRSLVATHRAMADGARRGPATSQTPAPMVRDRICNTFLPRSRALCYRHGNEEHFFCSDRCRQTFLATR